jgi:hypothetical protein
MISSVQLISILTSALLYFGCFHLNMMLFNQLELHSGANWIFLPAGVRLLCTLLLAGGGAIGLLIASLIISFETYASMGVLTNLGSAMISAGAPYLVYRIALLNGLPETLEKLNAVKLTLLSLVYASLSALLHSLWYMLRGVHDDLLSGIVVMFFGDLIGTLLVLYTMKIVLATLRIARGRI